VSTLAAHALRVVGALGLLLVCWTAAVSPAVPVELALAAVVVFLVALVQPQWGMLAALAVAPWGARLAGVPVRASEFLVYAALAGWLLRVDGARYRVGRTVTLAGLAYVALALVSWTRLEYLGSDERGWPGVWSAIRGLDSYLIVAGRDPHTAALMQILLGIGLALAVATVSAERQRFARQVCVVVASGALLAAAATVIAVPIRYYASGDWNEVIRYFVATRSRYAFHVSDVNAAGSHFLLAGALVLSHVLGDASVRARWFGWGSVAVTLIALWICGSRTAMASGVGVSVLLVLWSRAERAGWRVPRLRASRVGLVALMVLLLLVLAPTVVGRATATRGSASRSMSVREEFLVTSARMLSTAPVFGVGVGTYAARSSEFMPPGIRRLYGRENAHDYFMQTAAELGLVGAAAFLWWLGAALAPLWQRVSRAIPGAVGVPPERAVLGALVAFLLTAVTGHPLLVIEVSVPFWALIGVAASGQLGQRADGPTVY
jgi:O-antigen ligase